MKFILSTLFTLLCITLSARNSIEITRLEHNVMHNGQKCIAVHLKMEVSGYKGKALNPSIYVYKKDGTVQRDKNNRYCTNDGQVANNNQIKPGYDNTTYSDWVVYLPNDEVHAPAGKHDFQMSASLFYNGTRLAKAPTRHNFSMTTPASSTNRNTNNSAQRNNNSNSRNQGSNIVKTWTSTAGNMTTEYTRYADGSLRSHTKTQCIICHGSGVCGICGGNGYTVSRYGYLAGQPQTCGYCLGKGKCRACSGKGISETVMFTDKYGNTNGISNGGEYVVNGLVYNRDGQVVGGTSGRRDRDRDNSRNSRNTQRETCTRCHGTGIDPNQSSGGDLSSWVARYNSPGNICDICGRSNKHWHTKCPRCNVPSR